MNLKAVTTKEYQFNYLYTSMTILKIVPMTINNSKPYLTENWESIGGFYLSKGPPYVVVASSIQYLITKVSDFCKVAN